VSPVPHLSLIIVGVGILLALGLAARGVLDVVRRWRALKARLDAYADLPVLAYVHRTSPRIGVAATGLSRAPALVYRAKAALSDLTNAFAKIRKILTTPASIWRLGELLVTGK